MSESAEKETPVSLCYRARWATPHQPHTWRNGIEVQYEVRCPGYVPTPTKP